MGTFTSSSSIIHPSPSQMTRLPIAVAYFFFLGFWLLLCLRSDAPPLHTIHHLMSCVLLVKALTSLTSPLDPRDDPLTQLLRGFLLLALTLLLVEITRKLILPLRQNGSKKAMTAVITAQILANVVIGEMEGTSTVIMEFMAVNLLAGFSILGCIVWHVAQLGEEMKGAKKLEERRAVDRARIFVQYYTGVIALSHATKLLSSPLRNVNDAAEEIASMVCYTVMFYWFRPEAMNRSEYFITVVEEEDAKQLLP